MLLVDDEVDTIYLFTLLLEVYGAKVAAASTVAEGVRKAEEIQPNVVISDIRLPDGSGVDLLERLQNSSLEKVRDMPVVAVTGQVTPLYGETLETGMKSTGFQAFLVKPIDANQLIETILVVTAGPSPVGLNQTANLLIE